MTPQQAHEQVRDHMALYDRVVADFAALLDRTAELRQPENRASRELHDARTQAAA